MPMLIFYIMSLMAVVLRILTIIYYYTFTQWMVTCAAIQPVAKMCVGLVQSWMMLEVSMKIRGVNFKNLNYAQYATMAFVLVFFCSLTISFGVILANIDDYNIYTSE